MSARDKQLDSFDEWLARQPLEVSADFTPQTLARIRRDRERAYLSADDCLDALFKQGDCVPSADFAGDALRRVRPHPRRIAGVPAWVATLAGMAASLLLGILAFAFLFHQARNVESVATMAREPLSASAVLVAPTERSTPVIGEPSVWAMEDLFIMDMALQEIAGLEETDAWHILAMLME